MGLSPRLESLIARLPVPGSSKIPEARLSLVHDDELGRPSERLIDLSLEAIRHASREDLSAISSRMARPPLWPDIWPGEHFRLLAGLVKALQPSSVVEIGTWTGLSALALAKHLPPGGTVHTYDLVPWNEVEDQALRSSDLDGGRIVPVVGDLTRPDVFDENRPILESAQLLFVDAAKDGRMERQLLDAFETVRFRVSPIVIFDDIRLWNMLGIWRDVSRPKLDITSFGHWSGTGLIDWRP